MSKNETQPNDYRAERKKRLTKEAKKQKNSTVDSVKIVSVIIRVIAVLAVVALAGFGVYQFGIPHKVLPAIKVDDKSYSVAEYGFYYSSVFQSFAEQQNSLGLNTFDIHKDPSLQTTKDEDGNQVTYDELIRKKIKSTLEAQNYYLDKCEEEGIVLSDEKAGEIDKTVSEIANYAKQYGYSTSRYISLLYGKGMNEKSFRNLLQEQMLVSQYIEGQEDTLFKDISDEELEAAYAEDPGKYQLADIRLFGFETEKEETPAAETTTAPAAEETTAAEETETTEAPADEETTAAEAEETTAAEEETKEPSKQELLANEMLAKITDEASFNELCKQYAKEEDKKVFEDENASLLKGVKKDLVAQQVGKDMGDWLFAADRVAGDKTVYATDEYVYVVYVVTPAYRVDEPLVDARHILISFDSIAQSLKNKDGNEIDTEKKDDVEVQSATTEEELEITNEGTGYSIELVTEAYKAARDVLDEFVSGEQTQEAFAELANKYSQDKGSVGENGNGGLYQNIEKGKMVKPFEDWVYAEDRQPGDTDIIMTQFGWHVMYFVEKHEDPAWKEDVRTILGNEKFTEIEKEVETESKDTATDGAFINFAGNEACKLMTKLYAGQPQQDNADHNHEGHNH